MKYYLVTLNVIFCCALLAENPPHQAKNTHEPLANTHPKPHKNPEQESFSGQLRSTVSESVHNNSEQTPPKHIAIDPDLEQRIAAKKEKWQKQQDIFTTTESVATASSIAKVPITLAKPALSALKELPVALTVGGAIATAAGIAIVGGSNSPDATTPVEPLNEHIQEQPTTSIQGQDIDVEEVP
jgi:hypothetical protein